MSRIYDALKKLEAERLRRGGNGRNGGGNGGNGGGNGGNGGGNGKRKGWRRFFAGNGRTNGHAQVALGVPLDPEAEEAYQRLGTNLLVPAVGEAGPVPRLLGVTASRHGEGTTTTAAVFASILVRRRGGRVAARRAHARTTPSLRRARPRPARALLDVLVLRRRAVGRALPLGVSAVKGRTMRIGTLIALAVAILAAAAFPPTCTPTPRSWLLASTRRWS